MSLVSEINNQAAAVQTIVVPQVINASTNSSSTLPPIKGSLCTDPAVATKLYMGDGTNWNSIIPSSQVFSNGGTGTLAQLSLSALSTPTVGDWNICSFGNIVVITIQATMVVAIGGSGQQIVSQAGAVPLIYRPSLLGSKTVQVPVQVNGVVQTGSVVVGTDGTLTIYSGWGTTGFGTTGNNGIMQCSFVYGII